MRKSFSLLKATCWLFPCELEGKGTLDRGHLNEVKLSWWALKPGTAVGRKEEASYTNPMANRQVPGPYAQESRGPRRYQPECPGDKNSGSYGEPQTGQLGQQEDDTGQMCERTDSWVPGSV